MAAASSQQKQTILNQSEVLYHYRQLRKVLIWDNDQHPIRLIAKGLDLVRDDYVLVDDDLGLDWPYPATANKILLCYGYNPSSIHLMSADKIQQIIRHFKLNWPKKYNKTGNKYPAYGYLYLYDSLARINPRQFIIPRDYRKKVCSATEYICLDFNLILDATRAYQLPYHDGNLKIAAFCPSLYSIALDRLTSITQEQLDQIRTCLHTSEKGKDIGYNLDSHEVISSSKWRQLAHINYEYKVGSNNAQVLNSALEIIRKQIEPEEYRLQWVLNQIKGLPVDNYFNCDTHRINKSNRGFLLAAEYNIISKEQKILDFWRAQCVKYKLPRRQIATTAHTENNAASSAASSAANSSNKKLLKVQKAQHRLSAPPILSSTKNKHKRKAVPSSIRFEVWRQMNGDQMSGPCFCCDRLVKFEDHQTGHIQSVAEGGNNSVDNLRPICGPCNRSMGKKHMYSFMQEYSLPGLRHFRLN